MVSNGTKDYREELRNEALRVHETATAASQTQFEYAKRWRRVDRTLGAVAALFAAVAGVGALSDVLPPKWVGLVAIISAGLGAVAASLGAPQTKEKASVSANAFRALQQDARILAYIDLPQLTDDEARQRLQQLVERQQQLSAEAQVPSLKAWTIAKRNLARGAQTYEADR